MFTLIQPIYVFVDYNTPTLRNFPEQTTENEVKHLKVKKNNNKLWLIKY